MTLLIATLLIGFTMFSIASAAHILSGKPYHLADAFGYTVIAFAVMGGGLMTLLAADVVIALFS
jgi:hypothetical protein